MTAYNNCCSCADLNNDSASASRFSRACKSEEPNVFTSLHISRAFCSMKVDLENSEIIIMDEVGRVLYRRKNETNTSLTLNLNNLRNGVYYIQVKNLTKSETKKFIINK
jgi:hypothetical protein